VTACVEGSVSSIGHDVKYQPMFKMAINLVTRRNELPENIVVDEIPQEL
jgi:hypothetical protein